MQSENITVIGIEEICIRNEREREMFYLTMHSTHFIYGYMASDIWLRTILIVRKGTHCHHIGYSYWLTARVLLYAPSHRQDNTYHSLCYTSHGALAGTRNSSMGALEMTAGCIWEILFTLFSWWCHVDVRWGTFGFEIHNWSHSQICIIQKTSKWEENFNQNIQ